MNPWKPLAIFSTGIALGVLGAHVAAARTTDGAPASMTAEYRQLRSALDALRAARDHLVNGEHDHGGWRERAIEGTDRAIHETEEAMKWTP